MSPIRTRARALASPLRVAALLVATMLSAAPANAQDPAVDRSDPRGDVKASGEITAEQRDSVDLTGVTYRVDRTAETLTVRFDLVDLAQRIDGTQYLETTVHGGDFDLKLFSTPEAKRVRAFDGTHLYGCRGSRVMTSYARNYVKHVIPLDCVADHTPATLRSNSTLSRDNGSTIASDTARRSRSLELS